MITTKPQIHKEMNINWIDHYMQVEGETITVVALL